MIVGKCKPPRIQRDSLGRRVTSLMALTILVIALVSISIETARAQTPKPQHFDLRIEKGRISGNLTTIRVQRNDMVEITWSADRRTVLHLHGYNVETVVESGKSQTMSFTARATGRFPIETHGERHSVVVYLEVHPR